MRVREVLLFLLVSVLMASIVVGALVIREGRPPVLPDDSAGEPWSPRLTGAIGIKADRSPGTGPSEAYAGGPGQIVLEWTSDVTGAVRWQYRLLERFGEIWDPPTGREVWGEWTDVPGSDGDTNRIRVGGLREVTLYVVEVRPLIGNGARSAATVGEPVAIGSARTLFVGDDGIPWLRVNDRVGGGGTFRIGGTDYVIELPRGMVMNPSIHDERFEDERFSSRIAHFEALLRDSVTDSYLVMNSGEYVRRVIAWHGARGSDEASTAAARRVNEWFDAIVGSTRLFPRQGVGPAPFFRFPICRSGEAVADPHRNPGLASDCYVLLVSRVVIATYNGVRQANWCLGRRCKSSTAKEQATPRSSASRARLVARRAVKTPHVRNAQGAPPPGSGSGRRVGETKAIISSSRSAVWSRDRGGVPRSTPLERMVLTGAGCGSSSRTCSGRPTAAGRP